ncbi:NAD(+) diphosphatase [Sphingomonas astaxanthinifaciens]|uniref:NAD(+) diphosphatase n=1 Tax=Sphingomonas astaxanthinifaciens DSM 22298 TaxID=1123267 RepID=A0ABQ5Z730_9SPHN|nr:NAD(+) diphosphatase [Sphingomonas astaxanthinifaciens]GLR47337.1 NADH pyrophosphatase [Sphingomonas astaxanthinifaciens DSM 22298]
MPTEIFFAGPGLDRVDSLRSDPEQIAALARSSKARALVWENGLPAIDAAGSLRWEKMGDAPLFLGMDGDCPCFSSVGEDAGDLRAQFNALGHLGPADAPIFAAATSLASWHRRHGFCAVCGHASAIVRGGWSRQCPHCGAEHFPRVDPVVIMLAEHEGRVLLGRQPRFPVNRYSALAGFVEVGEGLEDAVARELFEEAGVRVHDVRYVASQPWPFPSSLMIACTARSEGDALTVDTTELEDARWFTRDEVAAALAGSPSASFIAPPPFAIARSLLEHWLAA